jgi:thiol-disulfide isomerase/thioredoxin
MKVQLIVCLIGGSLLISTVAGTAADKTSPETELKALVSKIQVKLQEGKKTEADLSDELKEFDQLLAEHKGEKTDEVAQILLMKAKLYSQVLHDEKKTAELTEQLKTEFPDSEPVKMLKEEEAAKKTQAGLVDGAKFPDFNEKDVAGKPLSIANYKGKVVLLDFWATWCGPCRAELPNVLKTYEKHHPKGFEIIGVSLDQDKEKLMTFAKDKEMTWQQFFDGKGWGNKLAVKYGIQSIPATFLLDGEGKILGKNLRGEELEQAVAKAVAKN